MVVPPSERVPRAGWNITTPCLPEHLRHHVIPRIPAAFHLPVPLLSSISVFLPFPFRQLTHSSTLLALSIYWLQRLGWVSLRSGTFLKGLPFGSFCPHPWDPLSAPPLWVALFWACVSLPFCPLSAFFLFYPYYYIWYLFLLGSSATRRLDETNEAGWLLVASSSPTARVPFGVRSSGSTAS